ncbi:DnaJ family domain-containing protein [Virgibacillus flavescens]|uniref:DnaJ family domain-containing protein n=1 Tax=Virgibacillus flavescens TaxID=1611422 RepID=UPI003D3290FB
MDEEYYDPIGDMIKASEKEDKIKGKGKPLSKKYLKQDVFQNFQEIAKDAGFLPPWLRLQKEIAVLVHAAETESDIDAINIMIRKHNTICPTPLQKNLLSMANLDRAKEMW